VLLCYITCLNNAQAQKIANYLLQKKLCACVNIFTDVQSLYLWPAGSNNVATDWEVVLVVKTLVSKYQDLEKAVVEQHSYEVPCILAFSITVGSKK